jgi:hypothetical protein
MLFLKFIFGWKKISIMNNFFLILVGRVWEGRKAGGDCGGVCGKTFFNERHKAFNLSIKYTMDMTILDVFQTDSFLDYIDEYYTPNIRIVDNIKKPSNVKFFYIFGSGRVNYKLQ